MIYFHCYFFSFLEYSLYLNSPASLSMQRFYLLASCGNDDNVKLWLVKSGLQCTITLSHVLEGHTGNVNSCRFSPDGSLLASAYVFISLSLAISLSPV